ncbi:relaxase/mobilization nuclease domain-containing protein [Clostridiaceae bacterium OttesenSCG-928-D20]|nr:relaxase/mobilization nuclease domain-containing protein [Clostridiaceae bacterium OttesenSCG-928-D20]
MATTSIWAVKSWLGKVISYAQNPDKTEITESLMDVLSYATQEHKTRRLVSGINCQPSTVREEMQSIKVHFGKTDGVVAYHGYQSFAPGEASPDMAHEIGVKLAQRLWGNSHQVVVATHLDKENHLHNHFVLNNVSMVDGKKYYRSEKDYYNMQQESDTLCREYGLSVIEKPQQGKSMHYGEWNAEKQGHPTWRSLVKSDVDTAIRGAMTDRQFWDNLKKLGYEVKQGKDISVRPPGKERFVRLGRNFGEDYAIESIRKRILEQTRPTPLASPQPSVSGCGLERRSNEAKRMLAAGERSGAQFATTRLRALYFYYLYKLGALPKKRTPNPKQVYFLLREDIRYMQNISREARLLAANGIDTDVQLAAYKDGTQEKINALYTRRKSLRNRVRSITDEDKSAELKIEIASLSERIGVLRREVRLCENIEKRSAEMSEKLRLAMEAEKSNEKEVKKDEPFRRRR